MAFFPDRNSDPEREEVLSNAPFLRTFLNSSLMFLKPEQWSKELIFNSDKIQQEFKTRLGNTWGASTLTPLTIMSRDQRIFHPDLDYKALAGIVSSMLGFGYELETDDNRNVLLPEIVSTLRLREFFNPVNLMSVEGALSTTDHCIGLLNTGIFIKKLPPEGVAKLYRSDIPPDDPFTDYIDKLQY